MRGAEKIGEDMREGSRRKERRREERATPPHFEAKGHCSQF